MKSRISIDITRQVIQLVPTKTIKRLSLLLAFQLFATMLDVSAILILGILTKTGLDFVQNNLITTSFTFLNGTIFSSLSFERQFVTLAILVIALFTVRTGLSIWGNRKILNYLGAQSAVASKNVISKLFSSKPKYLLSKNSQQLLYGITIGIDNLVLFYVGSLVLLIAESIFLMIILLSLLVIQPVTGLCALTIFGLSGLLIHKITAASSRSMSEISTDISVKYNQGLLETLSLYRELFLKGSISQATNHIHELRAEYLNLRANLMFLPILSKYLFEFVLIIGSAVVACIQLLVSDVNGAIGAVAVFLATSSRVLPSIIRLQSAFLSLKQAEGAGQITLRQVNEVLRNQAEEDVKQDKEVSPSRPSSLITIKNMSFKYPESDVLAISNLSFDVMKGQMIAIVGESGSGKSTLADLILGMQEPTEGNVSILGMTPKQLIEKFPGYLAYVPQDISIMEGDITKNVSLDFTNSDFDAQVTESLKKAALWDEIQKMPHGLRSSVGERGFKLSGGQKQRLGIARSLFSKPKVIIFDEATSALDALTEKVVTEAIYTRRGEVTLIVIAHRLSTVKNADKVLLLDKGRLVANGTFEEVRTQAPKFDEQAKLVNL